MEIPSGEKVAGSKRLLDVWVIFFNSHGDNSDLCKERARKAISASTKIISLCKEINFGKIKSVKRYYSVTQFFCLGLSIIVKHGKALPVKSIHD